MENKTIQNFLSKIKGKKSGEPITNTTLLLSITIATFVLMYGLSMLIWGGGFLNPQQFVNIFNNNSYLIIISCGLTVVMIGGGIDISVGGMIALITMTCVVVLEDYAGGTFGIFGTMLLALGMGLTIGSIQGFLISYLKIQPFIVTLGGMFFAKGMTTIVSGVPRTVTHEAFKLMQEKGKIIIPFIGYHAKNDNFIPLKIESGVIIALLVVLLIWFMLRWTRYGRDLYAVGGNRQSALMLGINVKRTSFFSYVISGLLAGVGGYAYLLHSAAGNAANATQAEIQAIASSIIGGTMLTGGVGSVVGTLFGVMSLKTINNIVRASGLREPYWQSITVGLMLCFFIVLQSVILAIRKKSGKVQ